MDRDSQLLRGVLDLAVLAMLCEGERYGYQIAQELEANGLGRVQGGTLYPLLARMVAAGRVTASWRPGEHGPGRKYYALTPSGRRFLRSETEQWSAFAARIIALLTRKGVTCQPPTPT